MTYFESLFDLDFYLWWSAAAGDVSSSTNVDSILEEY